MSEAVAQRRVGFWVRVLAIGIDLILVLPAVLAGDGFVDVVFRPQAVPGWLSGATTGAVWLAYSMTEVLFAGTPGKLILGLRIRAADGTEADGWRLFARWSTKQSAVVCWVLFEGTGLAGLYLLGGFLNLVLMVGFLYAGDEDKRGWHDQWCGTAVYRKGRAAEGAEAEAGVAVE